MENLEEIQALGAQLQQLNYRKAELKAETERREREIARLAKIAPFEDIKTLQTDVQVLQAFLRAAAASGQPS